MEKRLIITVGDPKLARGRALFAIRDGSPWQSPDIIEPIIDRLLEVSEAQPERGERLEESHHGYYELEISLSGLQQHYFKTGCISPDEIR